MRRALLVTGVLFAFAAPARAQDPVKADPKHYKVEFENEHVRVLRITYGPHEKSVMHEHPASVAVALTDTVGKFTLPDGETVDAVFEAGEVRWADAGKHQPENVSDRPFTVIQIELKK